MTRCRLHLEAPTLPLERPDPFLEALIDRSGGTLATTSAAQAEGLLARGWTLTRTEALEAPARLAGFEEPAGQLHLFGPAGEPRLPF